MSRKCPRCKKWLTTVSCAKCGYDESCARDLALLRSNPQACAVKCVQMVERMDPRDVPPDMGDILVAIEDPAVVQCFSELLSKDPKLVQVSRAGLVRALQTGQDAVVGWLLDNELVSELASQELLQEALLAYAVSLLSFDQEMVQRTTSIMNRLGVIQDAWTAEARQCSNAGVLPKDIWRLILNYISPIDRVETMSRVCRLFRSTVSISHKADYLRSFIALNFAFVATRESVMTLLSSPICYAKLFQTCTSQASALVKCSVHTKHWLVSALLGLPDAVEAVDMEWICRSGDQVVCAQRRIVHSGVVVTFSLRIGGTEFRLLSESDRLFVSPAAPEKDRELRRELHEAIVTTFRVASNVPTEDLLSGFCTWLAAKFPSPGWRGRRGDPDPSQSIAVQLLCETSADCTIVHFT